jgi:hypothetical protein
MNWRHSNTSLLLTVVILGCGCRHQNIQLLSPRNQVIPASLQTTSPPPTPTSPKLSQGEQIEKTWPSKFRFKRMSIKERHEANRGYEISAKYPQMTGAHTLSKQRFDLWIRKKIRGYLAEFKKFERSAAIHDKKKRLPPLGVNESLEIDYQVYYSNNHVISLRLTQTVMALGQMHPISYYETINYELRKGRDLQPSDVFKPGYLKAFAAYVRTGLKAKYDLADEWSRQGTMPNEHNFKNWNIVPDGIVLSFEDYQIAPHSFGQAEMIVPYGEFKRLLRSESVASCFGRGR